MSNEFISGYALQEGEKISRYTIVKALGQGSNAYPAMAKNQANRNVFFKKYSKPGGRTKWFDNYVLYQEKLKKKIQEDPRAKHNCYEIIEFFVRQDPTNPNAKAFYQVFEFVEAGIDLRNKLDQARQNPASLPYHQRLAFAQLMVTGITHLHRVGIVHTDLKPENLFLVPNKNKTGEYLLKIIDLDCSILENEQAPWHGFMGYFGTEYYMSPEHLKEGEVPGKHSDVFTMGIILSELLGEGHPAGHDFANYNKLILEDGLKPVRIPDNIPGLNSRSLEFIINSCIKTDSSKRPTALDLLKTLQEFNPGSVQTSPPPEKISLDPSQESSAEPVQPPPPPEKISLNPSLVIPGRNYSFIESVDLGSTTFSAWGNPDFKRFMASPQFKLVRRDQNYWFFEHVSSAINKSRIDGNVVEQPLKIKTNMVFSIGRDSKCKIVFEIAENKSIRCHQHA